MNRMQVIIFSIVAAAVVALGVAVPLGLGNDNNNDAPTTVPPTGGSPLATADNNGTGQAALANGSFAVLQDSDPPTVTDPELRIEKVATGLALPTSMAFLGNDDMLILQKDNGRVRYIHDGKLQENPVYDVFVENNSERGLLGIAVADGNNNSSNSTLGEKTVFLYYTEKDGDEVRNRIYSYNWSDASGFSGGAIVLDLPGTPGPNHDGGKLAIGPDGNLYAVIGDLNRNGMLQNYPDGDEPDDTSVILRITPSGNAISANDSITAVLSDNENSSIDASLARYYAYGVRNSFGLDFDPETGNLWDTENGPSGYDEINLVRLGFNSGWETVMGPIERTGINESDLVMFNGSHYADPKFSWRSAQGLTDIEFFNSTGLGDKYSGNIFVGDINNGNLYFFALNKERDGLVLDNSTNNEGLQDLVADNDKEESEVTLGTGFKGITDIETGPDGNLYILSHLGGSLYRIVPASS